MGIPLNTVRSLTKPFWRRCECRRTISIWFAHVDDRFQSTHVLEIYILLVYCSIFFCFFFNELAVRPSPCVWCFKKALPVFGAFLKESVPELKHYLHNRFQ